jgi:hypothetical protein
MMVSGAQRILFETFNDTSWIGIRADTTAGQWHHAVATYDGDTMQLYHDGVLTDSTTGAGILLEPSRPLLIGARSDSGSAGGFFTGSLDEVAYFSAVLSPEDVLTLMNDGLAAVTGVARPLARRPEPEDGAQHGATWVSLAWTAGDFAVSHDVYMSDNFDDVRDGAAAAFQGNHALPMLTAGFFGFPFPDGLAAGTTYYWRVDEINNADPNSPWRGDVWSFWIPPMTAYGQSPPDGANFVDADVTLNWAPGLDAKLHYVHFGDNFDDVNSAAVGTPAVTTTFTPGTLEFDKTYYWRVDESNPPNPTVRGDVWSFTTTLPGLGTAVMERWENIATTDINTLKNNPRFPNNPDVTETVTSFSWNGADIDDYGGRIEGWVYVPGTGDYTFWLNTDDQGELWLSTDDDSSNTVLIASESSYSGFNSWGTGEEQSAPIPLIGGEKYYITALWKEGGGGDHCQVAWQGPGIPDRTVIAGTYLSPYTPLAAYGAKPSNLATGVAQTPALEWKAGLQAASHELYFGTDPDAVANATKTSPEYIGTRSLGAEGYEPAMLAWDTTYYWRVDEVNAPNPDSPWVGKVWSFTTADFGIVEDFESYNDIPDGEPGSRLVYVTWADGFDNPAANGSAIGYITGATMETGNVHGGSQSAPMAYNNTTASISEVVRTFTPAQNWTSNGATVMSLWFYGNPGNTSGQLYVKINGVQVNYNGDSADLGRPLWHRWNIDLASVGTNLSAVRNLAIGVQGSGATGTLLLDDIELHRSVQPLEQIWLEAEAGVSVTPPMTISSDPLASGGGYIGTQDGITGDEMDAAPADGVATYSFTVQGGVYKIVGRVIIPGGDSFWVRIPGVTDLTPGEDPDQPGTGWVRWSDPSDGDQWHWEDVFSADHGGETANWTLAAGTYTLEIARREDGALLDAILITSDVE